VKRTALKRSAEPMKRKPIRRKSAGRKEQESLYGLVRQIILKRDGYACVMCGKGERQNRVLQAAHILPKGVYRNMRHELDNVISLCAYPCHLGTRGWHNDPIAARELIDYKFGTDYIPRLKLMADQRKTKKPDLKAVRLFLQQKLTTA
jgi:hypothetical protein